ncbi:MAG TPA: urease accessory protein UreD [Nocardioidaceae bacterium]|nr:urease accessory protein UreD [Nocardioidaceae bacterium]
MSARVALVPESALLLAGDEVAVGLSVGPGASLEVVETSGTVAYDMRGGNASWNVDISLGAGASLVWQSQPFVVSSGADVQRVTRARLAPGARLLMRETVVLGRHGERPGRLVSHLDAGVLVEELDSEVLPCRVLDTILAVGYPPSPGAMELHSGDHLYRALVDETHRSALGNTWAALAG